MGGRLARDPRSFVRSDEAYFSGLVLGYFVLGVLLASLALAIGAASLWNVDLKTKSSQRLFH